MPSTDPHTVRRLSCSPLSLAVGVVTLAACASSSSSAAAGATTVPPSRHARAPTRASACTAGLMDAAEASWNLRVLSKTPPSEKFAGVTNSDLVVHAATTRSRGTTTASRSGTSPTRPQPALKIGYLCPASQSDVSVYKNLLFVSGEGTSGPARLRHAGRARHGEHRPAARHPHLRHQRHRQPEVHRQRADLPRLAHPHRGRSTRRTRRTSTSTSPARPACARRTSCRAARSWRRTRIPNSALFRIEVIKVPLAHPEQAAIVSSPRIFNDLTAPPTHGEAPEDIAAAAKAAAEARAKGGFTADDPRHGDRSCRRRFVNPLLDSVVKARQRHRRADGGRQRRAARRRCQGIVDALVGAPPGSRSGVRPGPDPVPRHHRLSGDRAGRRRLRGLRPAARHQRSGATRSGSAPWPTRTSPTGTRRRSTTTAPRSCSPTSGAAAASRSAARPTSRSGAPTRSSRSRTTR